MNFDMNLVVNSFPLLLVGAGVTIQITVLSTAIGFVIGLIVGVARISHLRPLRMLAEAISFCRGKGYRQLFLGTLDLLKPARHLYDKFGFHRTKSEPYNEWDKNREMCREIWECELT